ncbi:ABC transporter permease [Prosthecobacter fluviatilis]|uniref:ABC transporter permease n=1 Tax=Prosthecobacter fluviatilis TaxID=445931 RepID=A0ABW0KNU9_9BACT
MTLLIGALIIGLILALLALGVLVSFRIFSMPDITTDGSITLGASITAVLLVKGVNPVLATAAGALGGAAAGAVTGVLHTKFKINSLLSGILVMTALYSVNLHIMGRSNVPLMQATTLASYGERLGEWLAGGKTIHILGWPVAAADAAVLFLALVFSSAAGAAMFAFFRTQIGTAMRATGDNAQMIRALGANVEGNIILGLALSNGFVALSGALLAQYQGFADAQMGIGMVVWGLASVIIGEALTGTRSLGMNIIGAIMGSVLFRLLVAIALRWGLNPNDLKLITALFVFAALVLPGFIERCKRRPTSAT